MKKSAPVKPKRNIGKILFYIAVPFWLLILTIYVVQLNAQLKLAAYANAQTSLNQIFENAKFEFCYQHDLKPCDDVSIKDYNATVSEDERFNLVRPQLQ